MAGEVVLVGVRKARPPDDAGVVDEDVEASEPLDGRIDERPCARRPLPRRCCRPRRLRRRRRSPPRRRTPRPASAPRPSMEPPRSLTTTLAPRSASSSAWARPIPRPAPVTTATRPSKLCVFTPTRPSVLLIRGGALVPVRRAATGAVNPRSPPRVPPTMAARSSAGTSANSRAMSSRLPRNVPFGVRVVVAPHDRRQPGDVPAGDGDGVVLERDVELALRRTRWASAGTATSRSGGTAAPCRSAPRAGGCRPSTPSHQSASWPIPVTQHLSMLPTSDASQWALNSISAKWRSG